MDIDSDQSGLALPGQATASANNTATSSAMTLALPQRQVARPALSTRNTCIQQRLLTLPGHSTVPVYGATASSFVTLAFRPHPVATSASSSRFSRAVATQSSQFLSLPAELKVHTLSFLPAQVASTCRAVCQDLWKFINGNQDHSTQMILKRNQSRLMYTVQSIGSNAQPTYFLSFLVGFNGWIERRGIVLREPKSTLKMFSDWVCHTFGHSDQKKINQVRGQTGRFVGLFKLLIRLQLALDDEVRLYGSK